MTEKIREYKMNGSLSIGVDAGYGNFKTARSVFPTAVSVSVRLRYLPETLLNGMADTISSGKDTKDLLQTK